MTYGLEEELARMRAGDNDEAEYRDITRQARADDRADALRDAGEADPAKRGMRDRAAKAREDERASRRGEQ